MRPFATIPPRHASRLRLGAQRSLGVIPESSPGERVGTEALLTAEEVAEMLHVTKAWVYAETRAKRIPHVPLGRYVRYRRTAVTQWITELERGAGSSTDVRRGGRGVWP
ncbi:MAG TPA: helix-turn-helix domain-containing protein [Solirubrobacteraceae bacterium]|nr:helix-turn-helix domain-containing protein [Solirubrobacteraceae bacterium]